MFDECLLSCGVRSHAVDTILLTLGADLYGIVIVIMLLDDFVRSMELLKEFVLSLPFVDKEDLVALVEYDFDAIAIGMFDVLCFNFLVNVR